MPAHGTIISGSQLAAHLDDPDWSIIDCRFYLTEPDRGESEYRAGHIPGAVYAHLDRDLSGPRNGANGRHPLPAEEALVAFFSGCGIDGGVQVVAYDGDSGAIAARLWWMLRYLGHDRVAVLDGGLRAWNRKGRPLKAGTEGRPPRRFAARVRAAMRVGVEQLTHPRDASVQMLLDARAPERYRGEVEPIDPVAGHIPGARNHPWETNLDGELRFLPLETLRNRFESTLGDLSPEGVVVYCGSGVTACHDLLAMEHAGLSGARLYAGSWSEWCADARRPVATGDAL